MSIPNAVPLGQPLVGASFGQAVRRFFQQYVGFSGRASRSEFWWAMLLVQLVSLGPVVALLVAMLLLVPSIVAAEAGTVSSTGVPLAASSIIAASTAVLVLSCLVLVVSLALVLPTCAALWRRLQDAGFHGAFALLSLVGLSIVPLIMAIMPSSPAGIRFDPAARAAAAWGQPAYGVAGYDPQAYGAQPGASAPHAYGAGTYGQPLEQPYGPPPASGPYDMPPEPSGR